MSPQKKPITRQGYQKIEDELNHLIKIERESLKKTIAEARALGDLKENAEYHAAKEKQSLVEGRIAHLQSILANSQIIDISKLKSDKIIFGARIRLEETESGKEQTVQIIGHEESDPRNGKISYESPLGKALIGKEAGDTVIVSAPKGEIEYEIVEFDFPQN